MTDRPARRRRAKHLMDGVTVACVSLAIAIGTSQLVKEGLQEFLFRPPGVGASPSEADNQANASSGADATQPPQMAQLVPAAPLPSPQPVEQSRRRHHGPPYR